MTVITCRACRMVGGWMIDYSQNLLVILGNMRILNCCRMRWCSLQTNTCDFDVIWNYMKYDETIKLKNYNSQNLK